MSGKDEKYYDSDERFELDANTLDAVAGGFMDNQSYDVPDFDTYRYWMDENGIIREGRC